MTKLTLTRPDGTMLELLEGRDWVAVEISAELDLVPDTGDTLAAVPRHQSTIALVTPARAQRDFDPEAVRTELWHAAMPGYTHPGPGTIDDDFYATVAAAWVAGSAGPILGSEGLEQRLLEHLAGGGIVACGIESHHRAPAPAIEVP